MLTIQIELDETPDNPRQWSNLGTIIFKASYRRGHFHLPASYDDSHEDLHEAVLDVLQEVNPDFCSGIENLRDELEDDEVVTREQLEQWDEYIRESIEKEFPRLFWVLGFQYHEHGCQCALSVDDQPIPEFDVSPGSGLIYASVKTVNQELYPEDRYPISDIPDRDTHVYRILRGELEAYKSFVEGQVYGYRVLEEVLDEDGEIESSTEVDSCWGFYSNDFGRDWETNGMTDHWDFDWKRARIVVFDEIEQEAA